MTGGDKYFGSRDGYGLSNKYDSSKLHPVPNAKKHHQGVCIPAKKGNTDIMQYIYDIQYENAKIIRDFDKKVFTMVWNISFMGEGYRAMAISLAKTL